MLWSEHTTSRSRARMRSWTRPRSGGGPRRPAQPCYGHSIAWAPEVRMLHFIYYDDQGLPVIYVDLERLIRVRDGPTVSDPVGAEAMWIEAAQISSREDEVVRLHPERVSIVTHRVPPLVFSNV